MLTKKSDNKPNVTARPVSAPASTAANPRKSERMRDVLARKMPYGFLFETPVPTAWESMLRRAVSEPTGSPAVAPARAAGARSAASSTPPTSCAAAASPRRSALQRLACAMAFDCHPDVAAALGDAGSQSQEPG